MVSYFGKRWIVVLEKRATKELDELPQEILQIMDDLELDLTREGPVPTGWIVKHVKGEPGVYGVRLKREYRAFYRVEDRTILIFSVCHRREAY